MRSRLVFCAVGAALATALAVTASSALADTQIVGAGATFPYPFFSRAFYEYNRTIDPSVSVNYQSIGSGGGIQQFTAKIVDFGASDVPMNAKELKAAMAANGDVVELPDTLGGIVIAYNVPGSTGHLRLTADLIAAIFLGKISNWDDPALARVNFGTRLPSLPIIVVHRADGSGTTFHFTDYLSHISPQWKHDVGNAKTVSWPAPSSVGAKGNEGVAGQVSNTPGAIGYIELAYAVENNISYAAVQNRAGNFVLPSVASVRAAAAQKPNVSASDFSIVDQPGANSYPICGYSWVMLWKNSPDSNKGRELVKLFRWLVTSGQKLAVKVDYVPLPSNVQALAQSALAMVR